MATLRVLQDLAAIKKYSIKGVDIMQDSTNAFIVRVVYNDLPNTPYDKTGLAIQLLIQNTYPNTPPAVKFEKPIHHINVDPEFNMICVGTLAPTVWNNRMSLMDVIYDVMDLVMQPDTNNAVTPELLEEYTNSREKFFIKAREQAMKSIA